VARRLNVGGRYMLSIVGREGGPEGRVMKSVGRSGDDISVNNLIIINYVGGQDVL